MTQLANDDAVEALHVVDLDAFGSCGVVAVHSTALGPAAGGCRLWHYGDEQDMVTDAVRLARGMSYKNALAGLPFGGGKAVLQRPAGAHDRAALFRAFGLAMEGLAGAYVTAEDVGTTVADMQVVRGQTRYVAGLNHAGAGAGGDPSPWTAAGVFKAMCAAAETIGLPLKGARVAIQGAGNVGGHLARLLAERGAELVVADVDEARAHALARELGATQVGADEVLAVDADVLAPCALGAVLDDVTVPRLKVRLVCGAANNQLAEDRHGDMLRAQGILYAPDYVVNAGGIINVCAEYLGESTRQVEDRVARIAVRLRDILRLANERDMASNRVADDLAREKIAAASGAAAA